MNGNDVNLLEWSYDDINSMRKKELVEQIQKMKGNVIFDSHVKDLCNQIENLTESLNQVTAASEKITCELIIVKNVNVNLENRIVNLEKLQAKAGQYNRRNNVEISGILNKIPDDDLENHVIESCKNSNIIINSADIEGCRHRLPLGRNSTTDNKRVIVKFVNRKHFELMLRSKKSISSKSKVHITNSLCPYCRYIWGKCKDLQRKGKLSQVFCLGAVVTIRVTENGPPLKILHKKDLMAIQECSHDV